MKVSVDVHEDVRGPQAGGGEGLEGRQAPSQARRAVLPRPVCTRHRGTGGLGGSLGFKEELGKESMRWRRFQVEAAHRSVFAAFRK